jgi:hypothetical protein
MTSTAMMKVHQAKLIFTENGRAPIRQQRTMQKELKGAIEREKAALAEKNEALAEIARLKALLEQQGKPH